MVEELSYIDKTYSLTERQFFALIRLALTGQVDHVLEVCQIDWAAIYELAEKQSVVGIVFEGVQKMPKDKIPDMDMLMEWFGQAEYIKTTYESQIAALPKVLNHLKDEKLPYLMLKGLGVAQYYPQPELRTCGDFDIWIQEDRQRVRDFAEKYGKKGHEIYHHIDAGQIEGVDVELHFTPSWMNNLYVNRHLQRWFADAWMDQRKTVAIGGCEVNVPSMAFNRVYLLLHIYGHLFNEGIGLRQIVDYYWVLMRSFEDPLFAAQEKIETVQRLKEFKLEQFAGALMWLMKEILALPEDKLLVAPDEKRGRFLLSEVMKAGNFGHFDERNTYNMSDPLAKRVFSRFKHDMRFLTQYPDEIFWTPIWRAKEWVMRRVR